MGEYEGILTAITRDRITIQDRYHQEHYWDLNYRAKLPVLPLEVGDEIVVEVEFNYYTAVEVRHTTLTVRDLDRRIKAIEEKLGL